MVFQLFQSRSQLIPNKVRCHSNEFAPIVIWVSTDSTSGENTPPSLLMSFSRVWSCVKGYFSYFNSGPNWFQTIPNGTSTNPPKTHLHSQGICFGGEWTLKLLILLCIGWKLGKQVFQSFLINFQLTPNYSRQHSNTSAPIQHLSSH